MAKVIIVEDNPVYSSFVCNLLAREGIPTEKASSLRTARKLAESMEEGDIVLADLRLPDGESTELLRWMREKGRRQRFIVMTDYAEVHTAVLSMKLGSEDYIPKRLLEERLIPLVRAIRREHERKSCSHTPIFKRTSAAFQAIKQRIRLVAPTDMSVLILGENGTGKEHIAQQIHEQSKRAGKPFIPVDCGSLSVTLASSAFFGHVKGAFTGADADKTGYFQEAEGGTLFLDEVGNLPYEIQQMLLRAIQEHRYRPVGAKEERTANVRIVTATNEDLHRAVEERRFRQDLLYRLRDYVITVPPLRDSRDDIMPLAEFFCKLSNKTLNKNVAGFDASARKVLLAHPWTGNVRELKQTVQAAVLQAEGNLISAKDLELVSEPSASAVCFTLKDEELEKERILRALKQADGNRTTAAQILGIGRTTLYRKIEEYGLK